MVSAYHCAFHVFLFTSCFITGVLAARQGSQVILAFNGSRGCDWACGRTGGFSVFINVTVDPLFKPDINDLRYLAGRASRHISPTAGCEICQDPSNAASTLLRLASALRDKSDGKNSSTQTLAVLWMWHFQRRSREFTSTAESIKRLANDFKAVERFQALTPRELDAEAVSFYADTGLVNLAHYYKGMARNWGRRKGNGHVLIFTCSYGNGHRSAAKAIAGYLQRAGFSAKIVDTTYDDRFYVLSNHFMAWVFNSIAIKRQHYSLTNTMNWMRDVRGVPLVERCPSPDCWNARKQQFYASVLDEQPDLLVTVYHMELLPVLEVAKDLGNLPILHIATDVDVKMREIFRSSEPVYPRFLVGIPYNIPESYESIAPVDPSRAFLTGYPVREEFLRPAQPAQVALERSRLGPADAKVLLIMTGGGGQDIPWPYRLAEEGIGQPLHILVVAGGNDAIAETMDASLPGRVRLLDGTVAYQGADKNVTVEVVHERKGAARPSSDHGEFFMSASKLVALMDAADVILTKPGGGSTAEAASRGIPAVFDLTQTIFKWEEFNVRAFDAHGRGVNFTSESEFRPALLRAMALGRNASLVQDEHGRQVDSAARTVAAAQRLLQKTECSNCSVFSCAAHWKCSWLGWLAMLLLIALRMGETG